MQTDLFPPKSEWRLPAVLPNWEDCDTVVIDLETCDPNLNTRGPGWAYKDGFIAGIALTLVKGKETRSYYLPIGHQNGRNLDKKLIIEYTKDLCGAQIPKVFHNALYDMGWLSTVDVAVRGPVFDTMIGAALLDENRRSYSLDNLAKDWCGVGKEEDLLKEASRLYGLKKVKAEMWKLPPEFVGPYAEGDTNATYRLWRYETEHIAKEGLEQIVDMEMGLIPLLLEMRKRGVRVDMDKAVQTKAQLKKNLAAINDEIVNKFGERVDIWAAASIARAFDKQNLQYPRTPKTGAPSFGKEWLDAHPHELPTLILRARKIDKTINTFMDGMILGSAVNGRIHPELHSLKSDDGGTVSGRFCIAKGQRVQIPGGTKPIEEVVAGDLVYSFDHNRKLVLKKVLRSGKTGSFPVIRLHWKGSGNKHTGSLDLTWNHEVRKYDGTYVKASELVVGDSVLALHRERMKVLGYNGLAPRNNHRITSIEQLDGNVDVYDIEVEETSNFICEEICVHNSCSNPNLQQTSARDPEFGPMVRGLFLPEEGDLWAALDYSSQEPRLTVHYAYLMKQAGAEEAVAGYKENPRMDYHQMVADIASIPRKAAKTINLGLAYGMGEVKLCNSLGLETELIQDSYGREREVAGAEGRAILDAYREKVPFVTGLSKVCSNLASERGWVRTAGGRMCRFDYWQPVKGNPTPVRGRAAALEAFDGPVKRCHTHKALNRLIQGSAADMTKIAMLHMWREGIVPMLTMHDELDISVNKASDWKRAEQIMIEALPLSVPTVVDCEFGESWGDAVHTWEETINGRR